MLKFTERGRKVAGEILPYRISGHEKSPRKREKQTRKGKRGQHSSHMAPRNLKKTCQCPECEKPNEHIVRNVVDSRKDPQGDPGDEEHPAIIVVTHPVVPGQDIEHKGRDGKGQRFITKYGIEKKKMWIGHVNHCRNPCHAARHRHLLVKHIERQDHEQAGGGYYGGPSLKSAQSADRAQRICHDFESGIIGTDGKQGVHAEEVLRSENVICGYPVQHRIVRRDVEGTYHQLDEEETHPDLTQQADSLKSQGSRRYKANEIRYIDEEQPWQK